jgi:hypothetical protein
VTRVRVVSSLAVSLLALVILAWLAGQPGRALRSPVSSTERGDAAIGSGYTLHAVTADRPRLVAASRRTESRTIASSPAAIGVLTGRGTMPPAVVIPSEVASTAPLHSGLSRRPPPALLAT